MNEYIEAYITFLKIQNIDIFTILDKDKLFNSFAIEVKSTLIRNKTIFLFDGKIVFFISVRDLGKIRDLLINFDIKHSVHNGVSQQKNDLKIVVIKIDPVELIQEMIKIEELFMYE